MNFLTALKSLDNLDGEFGSLNLVKFKNIFTIGNTESLLHDRAANAGVLTPDLGFLALGF